MAVAPSFVEVPMTDFPDYPAAHSMDAQWYAIDPDGQVAAFFTGEEGPLPLAANYFAGDLLENRIAAMVPEWVLSLFPADERHCYDRGIAWPSGPAVLVLRSAAKVPESLRDEDRPDEERYRLFTSTGGEAVVVRELTVDLYWDLHADGDCLGCYLLTEVNMLDHYFLYRPDEGGYTPWLDHPYYDWGIPPIPFSLTALPVELRGYLEQLVVSCPERFAAGGTIQPRDFTPCRNYGERQDNPGPENFWWLAWYDPQARRVRPIRGYEREYRNRFEELSREAHRRYLEIEPPAEPD